MPKRVTLTAATASHAKHKQIPSSSLTSKLGKIVRKVVSEFLFHFFIRVAGASIFWKKVFKFLKYSSQLALTSRVEILPLHYLRCEREMSVVIQMRFF